MRSLVPGLVLVLAASCATLPAGEPATGVPPAGETTLTVFHETHTHGDLEPTGRPGFERAAGLVRRLAAAGSTIFVGSGDDLEDPPSGFATGGQHVVDAFNASPLAANTYGFSELDLAGPRLRALVAASRFAWVTANVRDAATGDPFAAEQGARSHLIRTIAGLRVGITGVTSFSPRVAAELARSGVRIVPPVEAAREIAGRMRTEGAEVILVLSHLRGDEAQALIRDVHDVHAVLGAHAAEWERTAWPVVSEGRVFSSVLPGMSAIAQLDLVVREGRVISHRYRVHEVTADAPPDTGVRQALDPHRSTR